MITPGTPCEAQRVPAVIPLVAQAVSLALFVICVLAADLVWSLLAAVVFTAVRAHATWIRALSSHRTAMTERAARRLRLLSHLADLGPAWCGRRPPEKLTALATRGIDSPVVKSVLGTPAPEGVGIWPVPDARRSPVSFEEITVGPVRVEPLWLEPGAVTVVDERQGPVLAGLLMGHIVPDSGVVRVGGADLATLDPGAWRQQIAWAPRTPWLFPGTIAENIAVAVPGAPPWAVRAAAGLAGLAGAAALDDLELSTTREGGWGGGRGAGASSSRSPQLDAGDGQRLDAGDRQRIALARAALRCLLLDTPLVIIDEPAGVLPDTAVWEAMGELLRGRTVLVPGGRTAETWRFAAAAAPQRRRERHTLVALTGGVRS